MLDLVKILLFPILFPVAYCALGLLALYHDNTDDWDGVA